MALSNGIEFYYETHGDPGDPALLSANGLSATDRKRRAIADGALAGQPC